MPWIALVCACLVGGCFFDADYTNGMFRCRDGMCPAGMTCGADQMCRARDDAAVDTPGDALGDAMPDAMQLPLNCAAPGQLPVNGGSGSDTTANRTNKLAPQCDDGIMNGADAVYRIDPGVGRQMLVSINTPESYSVAAYVTSLCPSTACLTSSYATPNNPISVMTLAGPHYIVVDSINATMSGQYTLTVSFP
jgi:hypothetical protein